MTDEAPVFQWPLPVIPMPCSWNVQAAKASDGSPVIVIPLYTPSGALFISLPRDDALLFASQVRKAAQTGPAEDTPGEELITPTTGLIVP